MAKIVRHRTILIRGDDDGELSIRLKKWSASKLFFLVRDFWGMIEEGLTQVEEFDKLSEVQLIRVVIERLLSSEKRAAQIIQVSIDDPKSMSCDGILDWDAEDFVRALTEVLEMNLTEELVKNFQRLLANFQEKIARGKKKPKTEPEPVSASNA